MVDGKDRMGVERERNRWRATDMYVHMHGGIYFEKVGGRFGGSETHSLKERDGTVLIRVGGTEGDEMDEQGMGV